MGEVKIHNVEQGSQEWHTLRRDKQTGSKWKDIITNAGLLKAEKVLRTHTSKIKAGVCTGMSLDISNFISPAMEWGVEHEPELFDLVKDGTEKNVGFFTNSDFRFVGHSPDLCRFNKSGEMVHLKEFKCPNSDTHLNWHETGVIPAEHFIQTVAPFALVPTLESVEFVSYDPRNSFMPIFRIETTRGENEAFINNVRESFTAFDEIVKASFLKIGIKPGDKIFEIQL